MTYREFRDSVAFGHEVQEDATEVVVRVFVKQRNDDKLVANVGGRMERQSIEIKVWDALVQGTVQPLSWDVLIRGAKRMLFYHILANFQIENVPDLKDHEIEIVLSELKA